MIRRVAYELFKCLLFSLLMSDFSFSDEEWRCVRACRKRIKISGMRRKDASVRLDSSSDII
jgi:hypothetical protein